MKFFVILFCFFTSEQLSAESVRGKISAEKKCDGKTSMVWLSLDHDDYKKRLLLSHTEVPVGGSFEFFVKPGRYQIRGSDPKGCEFFERVEIKNKQEKNIEVQLKDPK